MICTVEDILRVQKIIFDLQYANQLREAEALKRVLLAAEVAEAQKDIDKGIKGYD